MATTVLGRKVGDQAQAAPEDNGRLMTVTEVARFLRVHPNSVRRWADAGLLPSYRIGRRADRRFRTDDVAAYLANGKTIAYDSTYS